MKFGEKSLKVKSFNHNNGSTGKLGEVDGGPHGWSANRADFSPFLGLMKNFIDTESSEKNL